MAQYQTRTQIGITETVRETLKVTCYFKCLSLLIFHHLSTKTLEALEERSEGQAREMDEDVYGIPSHQTQDL